MPKIVVVDARHPEPAALGEAARILRLGGLVAFPTETVYGLGANALDPRAVAQIFEAKGRPPTNPLIVHVARIEHALALTTDFPPEAHALAAAFWPGPLTLVLPRSERVPDEVTAGLDTVAIRVPAHPVALELLRLAGIPVAAPSANRYTAISPTTAQHVLDGIGDQIDMLVDGGPCPVGIESTVVSVVGRPQLLRLGMIDRDALRAVVPDLVDGPTDGPARSPGQAPRHYAPRARLRIVDVLEPAPGVGTIARGQPRQDGAALVLPDDPAGFAAALYAALHHLDSLGVTEIQVARPPPGAAWDAIRDRLDRASHPG